MPLSNEQDIHNNTSHGSRPVDLSPRVSPLTGVKLAKNNAWWQSTVQHNGGSAGWPTVAKSKPQNKILFPSQEMKVDEEAPSQKIHPATFPNESSSSPDMEFTHADDERDMCGENIPSLYCSPDNLIVLDGSTSEFHEGEELQKFGWMKNAQRAVSSGYPSQVSHPTNRRRPLSFQFDGANTKVAEKLQSEASSCSTRRNTMYTQARYPPRPPLPHEIQAHYFGAPTASLTSSSKSSLIPGEGGYYCGFDILMKENVVVAGYSGGVKIFAISKKGLTQISSIDGLRGGVHNAKILPWIVEGADSGIFPLIALVINGPSHETHKVSNEILNPEEASTRYNGTTRGNNFEDIDCHQTTVELYSLSGTKQYVSTLLSLPKTHLNISSRITAHKPPAPVGALGLQADAGTLIITSGTTGETWIFRQARCDDPLQQQLKCIGKVWTTVQQSMAVESSSPKGFDERLEREAHFPRNQSNASIISLNGRWLAYCPPDPSSQTSLRATVPGLHSTVKIPGLTTNTPPQVPGINCGIETPGGESVMKQIIQISTQKVIKAGNYLAQQGMQAWTNYRNKPSTNSQSTNGGSLYQAPENMTQNSPPTYSIPAPTSLSSKDPDLISILDLTTLNEHVSQTGSSTVNPLSTFRVPHGCSFLSFSPDGIFLFTASCKGDVQFVWDLMRIKYTKSSLISSESIGEGSPGPHVRQVAQFFRMTIARIVDVVWTSPYGERAAMVTEPGTIHILDLPVNTFTGSSHRRRSLPGKPADTNAGKPTPTITASGVATSAVNSLWTAARPLVSRRRRSSACLSARAVTIQAGNGTQALAAGISRSVGAATGKMNEIRKSGGTKLHLPRNATVPERSCVLLLHKKQNDLVIALAGGVIRLYNIKSRRVERSIEKQKASVKMLVEFQIPMLPDGNFASNISPDLSSETMESNFKDSPRKIIQQASLKRRSIYYTESSIPQAEIESNAPYQPFHASRSIRLHTYCQDETPLSPPTSNQILKITEAGNKVDNPSEEAWVFGGEIKSNKLDVGSYYNLEDELEDLIESYTLPSGIESVTRISDNTEESEQIKFETRRRKAPLRPESGDKFDEFGFFEDGCEVLDFTSQRK